MSLSGAHDNEIYVRCLLHSLRSLTALISRFCCTMHILRVCKFCGLPVGWTSYKTYTYCCWRSINTNFFASKPKVICDCELSNVNEWKQWKKLPEEIEEIILWGYFLCCAGQQYVKVSVIFLKCKNQISEKKKTWNGNWRRCAQLNFCNFS